MKSGWPKEPPTTAQQPNRINNADDFFSSTLKGATTTVSAGGNGQDEENKNFTSLNRSLLGQEADEFGIMLPSIKGGVGKNSMQSPFKGFLDISIVTQKLRKNLNSQDGTRGGYNNAQELLNSLTSPNNQGQNKLNAASIKASRAASRDANTAGEGQRSSIQAAQQANAVKHTRFKPRDSQVQMSPKVLETWINETLTDAEHLDIPGVLLKPEHKNPIARYGIDRMAFSQQGIPNELVDRVYRALFVYSVGFYELLKRCLEHTEKKFMIITNIWKVFAILLEYCCRTDYRMLISEVGKEYKIELEKLEADYNAKFQDQTVTEKQLKENQERLMKINEELERDRIAERQLRLKLEEDYLQNTKNHEEEVQLRLKFESKLNNMHSAHRDLESKYKRVLNDLANAQKQIKMQNEKLTERNTECQELKSIKAEQEATIMQDKEEIASLNRELTVKNRQLKEIEQRSSRIAEELDQARFKMQEGLKEVTELKLRIDVQESTIEGLKAEKQHNRLELKETRELLVIFEKKAETLTTELHTVTADLNKNRRLMITYNQTDQEKTEKIAQLKSELKEWTEKANDFEQQLGALQISHEKIQSQLGQYKTNYEETVEKLHMMNKARHDLETKLTDEIERNRSLQDIIRLKEETILKRGQELEEMDKKCLELERTIENIEIKKQAVERTFELTKKQLTDKIAQLQEQIVQEKETRDMWVERFEKEQKCHTLTNTELLTVKSELKDSQLSTKNMEIKHHTVERQVVMLEEQILKMQDEVNNTKASCENFDRELNTEREIRKQIEITKKEYIDRLKRELDHIEEKYQNMLNAEAMQIEDCHSQARINLEKILDLRRSQNHLEETVTFQKTEIVEKATIIADQKRSIELETMRFEDCLEMLHRTAEQSEEWQTKHQERGFILEDNEIKITNYEAELLILRSETNKTKADACVETEILADFFKENANLKLQILEYEFEIDKLNGLLATGEKAQKENEELLKGLDNQMAEKEEEIKRQEEEMKQQEEEMKRQKEEADAEIRAKEAEMGEAEREHAVKMREAAEKEKELEEEAAREAEKAAKAQEDADRADAEKQDIIVKDTTQKISMVKNLAGKGLADALKGFKAEKAMNEQKSANEQQKNALEEQKNAMQNTKSEIDQLKDQVSSLQVELRTQTNLAQTAQADAKQAREDKVKTASHLAVSNKFQQALMLDKTAQEEIQKNTTNEVTTEIRTEVITEVVQSKMCKNCQKDLESNPSVAKTVDNRNQSLDNAEPHQSKLAASSRQASQNIPINPSHIESKGTPLRQSSSKQSVAAKILTNRQSEKSSQKMNQTFVKQSTVSKQMSSHQVNQSQHESILQSTSIQQQTLQQQSQQLKDPSIQQTPQEQIESNVEVEQPPLQHKLSQHQQSKGLGSDPASQVSVQQVPFDAEPQVVLPQPQVIGQVGVAATSGNSSGNREQTSQQRDRNGQNTIEQITAQESERRQQIDRLQAQSNRVPKGNTNIRKLIKSAATRDDY